MFVLLNDNSISLDIFNNKTIFVFDTTVYKEYKNYCIVKGLKFIDIHNHKILNKILFDMIVLNPKNSQNVNSEGFNAVSQLINDSENLTIEYKCQQCGKITKEIIDKVPSSIQTVCSQECALQYTNEDNYYILQDPVVSKESSILNNFAEKLNNAEKFQTSMKKEAIRLEYAMKREKYKKEMRQVSSNTNNSGSRNISVTKQIKNIEPKVCKAKTKKGRRCTNRTVMGSDFCGIESHKVS